MSRFFSRGYHYDSASSSEEEDFLSSSEEELLATSSGEEQDSDDSFFNDSESEFAESDDDSDGKPYGPDWFKKPQFRKGGASSGAGGASRFLKGNAYPGSDDSSDEEGKKVVKSAKDKLLDEMNTTYNKIDAADLTQDWVTVQSEFENVMKLYVKAQQQNFGTPNVFVRVVAQVEDLVTGSSQAELKNKTVARAYNTVKQRVRKVAREVESLLAKYREQPDLFEKEEPLDFAQTKELSTTPFTLGGRKPVDSSGVAAGPSHSDFFSALRIVIDSRGKKGTDIQAQIKTMVELVDIAETPYESIIAYLNLIPIRFDACAGLAYQPLEQWKAVHDNISSLLTILEAKPSCDSIFIPLELIFVI